MEKEISKADCLMRLANTMSMDSVIGKRIRQQEVENNSKNPPLELLEAVFEAEHLKKLSPEEVVAIILHEIGHVFNPHQDLQQREFNADDFAISKGYGKHIKSSLTKSIANEPTTFNNPINRARVEQINAKLLVQGI